MSPCLLNIYIDGVIKNRSTMGCAGGALRWSSEKRGSGFWTKFCLNMIQGCCLNQLNDCSAESESSEGYARKLNGGWKQNTEKWCPCEEKRLRFRWTLRLLVRPGILWVLWCISVVVWMAMELCKKVWKGKWVRYWKPSKQWKSYSIPGGRLRSWRKSGKHGKNRPLLINPKYANMNIA